jgi:urea transport system permease protein
MSFHAAIRRLILALVLSLGAIAPSAAQQLPENAITRFLSDSFPDTEAAISATASSGAPHAADLLQALNDRRLLFSASTKAVFFRNAAGLGFDARTGEPADVPADATPVRLNNRLRGAVQAALGSLTLLSPDPQQRLRAAQAVFRSRDATALPALTEALAKETNPRVKRALDEARASVILADAAQPETQRMAAATTIADGADQDNLALLRQFAPTASGALKTIIDQGIARIERGQRIRDAGQTVWFGISLGSVLLLAAIGLAITFGVMGVINMAHGEMVMIGAYTTFVTQEFFRARYPGLLDWSLPVAIPLAFFVAAFVGILIERGVIRFLYGRPLETLLATFGVSLILQQAVRTWFGPTNREVSAPSYMSGSFDFLGLQITYGRLWIVVFTLTVFLLLLIVLKATPLGLQMRAVTQNRRMAASMGIRTRFVDSMTFGLGSGVAGIAGVALSQIDNVSPNLGQGYIIDSFMVVVFGGVGNLWGTFISALTLGIANKVLEPFAGAVLAKIVILVLLILFIQKRPRGLFALKGRAVEQ